MREKIKTKTQKEEFDNNTGNDQTAPADTPPALEGSDSQGLDDGQLVRQTLNNNSPDFLIRSYLLFWSK